MEEFDFLKKARERFDYIEKIELNNREAAIENLRFESGDQWPSQIKAERMTGASPRPCLTNNRLRPMIRKVVGDQRQNRIGIKVHPKDDKGSKAVAKIYEGIIREIEYQSNAYRVYSSAFQQTVIAGYPAFWRVITQYAEDSFDQEIRIERIRNQFSVLFDPDCQAPDYSDGKDCFVMDFLTRDEYEELFPDKPVGEWDHFEQNPWFSDDKLKIAEYFYRVPTKKRIGLLDDGSTIELTDIALSNAKKEGKTVKKDRILDSYTVKWVKMTGRAILEGPMDWAGSYIPIIIVPPDETDIENERIYSGLITDAKDPQRMHNYWKTALVEKIALAPKAPFLLTPEQIQNHETMWKNANKANLPYLLYNATGSVPTPQRQPPVQVEQGLVEEVMTSGEDINITTGIYQTYLGARSNETSGRAQIQRTQQSELGVNVFHDNLVGAVALTGRILVDLIPKIYDTQRTVPIRDEMGKETFQDINSVNVDVSKGSYELQNNVKKGKYGVAITVGPSYATQRMEAVDSMMQFVQYAPQAAMALADIIAENMDWPGAERIAARMKKLLPPQVTAGEGDGPPQPPPAPNPKEVKTQEDLKGKQLDNALKQKKLQEGGGIAQG
jgi:hypothetical protein